MTARMRGAAQTLLLVVMALGLASVSIAEDRRVVITTKKGDMVEGFFRGATEEKLSVEVAGQPLLLPIDGIRSITFAGGVGPEGAPAITDLAGVEQSLRPFHAALEIGMLRSEYAERLQQVLPPIVGFLKTRKPYWYPDAQLALNAALEAYKSPLASIYGWSSASSDWQKARAYLRYAEDVVRTDPPDHREDPREKPLALSVETAGRIGFGDAAGPEFLGSPTLADVYRISIARAGEILITAEGTPCSLNEELRDSADKELSTTHAPGGWAAKVKPGTYRLVVFCADGGVGTYKLRTAVAP